MALRVSDFDGQRMDGLEFCRKTYALFDEIIGSAGGVSRLRTRPSSIEKRLLEEFLPICRYVQSIYGAGRRLEVCWHDGAELCDAEIFQQGRAVTECGLPSDFVIEVVGAMHVNDHLMRRRLETSGGAFGLDGLKMRKGGAIDSEPTIYQGQDFVESFAHIVRKSIGSKDSKRYPSGTALLVQCALNMPYLESDWQYLMDLIRPSVLSTKFSEVFVLDTTGRFAKSFLL